MNSIISTFIIILIPLSRTVGCEYIEGNNPTPLNDYKK